MALTESTKLDELIRRLDEAVEIQEQKGCCKAVKAVLEEIVSSGEDFIDPAFLRPAPGAYARRLVHKDPRERYSLLAMVWDQGQGTALHDHAGQWCVECVYRGRIRVVSYDLQGPEDAPLVRFEQKDTIFAGVGEAGALIPPFDYHTIDNPHQTPAVTLHVYGGEMTWCHAFVPVEGGYRKERRELTYTA
jgi:3-mercaptopropionate dioxygenase